jgi:hypothetical protein
MGCCSFLLWEKDKANKNNLIKSNFLVGHFLILESQGILEAKMFLKDALFLFFFRKLSKSCFKKTFIILGEKNSSSHT